MNTISEHGYQKAMSNIYHQDRVTKYQDNVDTLLSRIVALESKIKELEQKIADVNDIEYY